MHTFDSVVLAWPWHQKLVVVPRFSCRGGGLRFGSWLQRSLCSQPHHLKVGKKTKQSPFEQHSAALRQGVAIPAAPAINSSLCFVFFYLTCFVLSLRGESEVATPITAQRVKGNKETFTTARLARFVGSCKNTGLLLVRLMAANTGKAS